EDGIRDDLVTGVQTCALPIYFRKAGPQIPLWSSIIATTARRGRRLTPATQGCKIEGANLRLVAAILGFGLPAPGYHAKPHPQTRSEERRVGKEIRCREGLDHY